MQEFYIDSWYYHRATVIPWTEEQRTSYTQHSVEDSAEFKLILDWHWHSLSKDACGPVCTLWVVLLPLNTNGKQLSTIMSSPLPPNGHG